MKVGDYDASKYGWAEQEVIILLKPYLKMIGGLKGKKILDIGCGSGWIPKIISKEAKEVLGVDISEDMIKRASEENAGKNINYKVMDAKNIGKLKEKFDVIVSALTLHNLDTLSKTFKGCEKILKDKGHMILMVPHPCFGDRNKRHYNSYFFPKNFSYFKESQDYKVKLVSRGKVNTFKSKFHSMQGYFKAFNDAGFVVTELVEPGVPNNYKKKFKWTSELNFPFYIIFKIEKAC